MDSSVEITPELLAGFIDEADDYLGTLGELLMKLEEGAVAGPLNFTEGDNKELMNVMFRAAHSLKGLSGAFGFAEMNSLNHRLETLFDEARMGKRNLDLQAIEVALQAQAIIAAQVLELKQPTGATVDVAQAMANLQMVLDNASPAPDSAPSADSVAAVTEENQQAAAAADNIPTTVLDDPELRKVFLQTTEEDIESLNQNLLKIEENATTELLTDIFRIAHTIKGACGAAELNDAHHLTHRMETLIDQLRNGQASVNESVMTTLLGVTDRLREIVQEIKQNRYSPWSQEQMNALFESASKTASPKPSASKAPETNKTTPPQSAPPPNILSSGQSGYWIQVGFDPNNPETDLQSFLVYNKLKEFGDIKYCDPDMEASTGVEKFTHIHAVLTSDNIDQAKGDQIKGILSSFVVTSVQVDVMGISTTAPTAAPKASGTTTPSASKTIAKTTGPAALEAGKAPAPAAVVQDTIRVDAQRLDELMNLGGELVINRARFSQVEREFKEVFSGKDYSFVANDLEERLQRLTQSIQDTIELNDARQTLKDMVDSIAHDYQPLRQVIGKIRDQRSTMHNLSEAVNTLGRVSDSMQKQIMGTRMVPVGPLFTRFKRVIRDAAKSLNKKIDFEIHGEQTELDKKMIDELADPLTHMIRNSVDHGIEMPEDRTQVGKDPTGKLILEAYHQGNNICIRLRDDGKGIDTEVIRKKIVEKGLVAEAQAMELSQRDLVQFIFAPGFSTAKKVSDLSGRGMGMDIVKTKIASLNGTVEVDTKLGAGTTVVIKLPLTLAIITSLLSRIGGETYAIPLESVSEIVTLDRKDMNYIQGHKVILVRGQVIPVFKLEELLPTAISHLWTQSSESAEWTLVILGTGANRIGLVVDRLIGQEDIVIKSLAENYNNIPGFAGATIMGDGRISLILDPSYLLNQQRSNASSSSKSEVTT